MLSFLQAAPQQPGPQPQQPQQLIVRLRPGLAGVAAASVGGQHAIAPELDMYTVTVAPGVTAEEALAELNQHGGEYAGGRAGGQAS